MTAKNIAKCRKDIFYVAETTTAKTASCSASNSGMAKLVVPLFLFRVT
jgi:hypothetical protein